MLDYKNFHRIFPLTILCFPSKAFSLYFSPKQREKKSVLPHLTMAVWLFLWWASCNYCGSLPWSTSYRCKTDEEYKKNKWQIKKKVLTENIFNVVPIIFLCGGVCFFSFAFHTFTWTPRSYPGHNNSLFVFPLRPSLPFLLQLPLPHRFLHCYSYSESDFTFSLFSPF